MNDMYSIPNILKHNKNRFFPEFLEQIYTLINIYDEISRVYPYYLCAYFTWFNSTAL